jgi:dTDP-4-amino-4,6-dideoxygalactose transaminase
MTRGEVMLALRAKGIGSQVHYIPVPYQPYYKENGLSAGSWPHAEAYYRQALTIPLYYGMSDADVATVIEAITDLVAGVRRRAVSAAGSH